MVKYYQFIYQTVGSQGSALTVVPFNQGLKQDVEALVNYIYMTLGMDLDYILLFATITENGHEIDGLDNKSKLAYHIMLVNLLCILGTVKGTEASCQLITHPTQVILPLSPNYGLSLLPPLDTIMRQILSIYLSDHLVAGALLWLSFHSTKVQYILPFAAITENSHEIDGLDDKSKLAYRIMLVNLLCILGAVKGMKASCQFITHPMQVILPLSPNHGLSSLPPLDTIMRWLNIINLSIRPLVAGDEPGIVVWPNTLSFLHF